LGGRSTTAPRAPALAPFRVRSFRFQWPADLATSLAFEMENLILGWYVLVETQSVLMLTVFASLTFIGTFFAPMFGVMGDRLGHRNMLCAMRALYMTLAASLMTLSFLDALSPAVVLGIVAMLGLVRPSDIGMRNALIGETMPVTQLMGAMGIQRTTQDSARVVGALTGAGLVAALGMGPAYAVVTTFYFASLVLTLRAGGARHLVPPDGGAARTGRTSPWRDLREGFAYVWNTPHLRAVMLLAFLLNLTAFPLFMNLLPVVAKDVYEGDRTLLGYMVACGASGALLGSIAMSRHGAAMQPARTMIAGAVAWLALILVFAHVPSPLAGIPLLILGGFFASSGQVAMAAILLRNSDPQYRGRLMGIRMLAIYGNVPGLLLAAPLIARYGYAGTATLYCLFGLAFTVVITLCWRGELWRLEAPANSR
jgi:MFS family permease